jgi:transcriptional regulator with XRE-family HTH domain
MNIRRQIGLNLRRLRVARNISQQKIALDVDMSLSYLSNIERGKANLSVSLLGRIADVLGVLPVEFLAPVSAKDVLAKNLKRGRNVHHQGRRSPKTRKR